MAESDPPKPHELDGCDEQALYDALCRERAMLISAKRENEEELVRTLIKLSAAGLLIVPGILLSNGDIISFQNTPMLRCGLILFVLTLILSMAEQFVSSMAYDRQIDITTRYYQKLDKQTRDPCFSCLLRGLQIVAFSAFIIGLAVSSYGLANT